MEIDIKQLKSLMRALRRYDLTEIEIRQGDEEVVIRRGGATAGGQVGLPPAAFPLTTAARGAATVPPGIAGGGGARGESVGPPAATVDDPTIHVQTSPLVGTFYRAPRPGAAPFVEVGDEVREDTVVAIVETMKLMNSVHAGTRGRVAEICLENAEPVGQGTTLMWIEPVS